MSNRFHGKWHRANHHSYKTPYILDAGWDPIAAKECPFSGDFYLCSADDGHGEKHEAAAALYGRWIHTQYLYPIAGDGRITVTGAPGDGTPASADLLVTRNITGQGHLRISGDACIHGNITGESNLRISGDAYISGDITGESDLHISGYGEFGEYVHIFGDDGTEEENGLIVDKNAHIIGSADIDENLNVDKFLDVGEYGNFGEYVHISGDDDDGYGLVVNENAHIIGSGDIDENLNVDKWLTVGNDISGASGLYITKTATITGDTTITTGNFTVTEGSGKFGNQVEVCSNGIHVTGDSTFVGNTSATSGNFVDLYTDRFVALSAIIKQVDITASEGTGFIVTGRSVTGASGEYPDPLVIPQTVTGGVDSVFLSGVGLGVSGWGRFYGETEFMDSSTVYFRNGLATTGDIKVSDGNVDETYTRITPSSLVRSVEGGEEYEIKFPSGEGEFALLSDIHDATLTITVNGLSGDTFTANASADKTIDIVETDPVFREWVNGETIAIGRGAFVSPTAEGAVQIGESASANEVPGTLRFHDTVIVNEEGKIPGDNLDINFVRSVNGTSADEDGNVEIDTGGDFLFEVEYDELVDLRDSEELKPGASYRITDYVATVANDANSRSANNRFDIIVVADSVNKLNEKARAIRHEGDTYFPDSTKFEAWQVWYCLDNDTNRFSWADSANGKGVVYRLIDEFGNDCPYDFKGIQFKRWAITNVTSTKISDVSSLVNSFSYSTTGKCFAYKSSNISVNGTVLVVDASTSQWHYTFSVIVSENVADASLFASNNVYGNKIGHWRYSSKPKLNGIVFIGINCFYNTFVNNCRSNTFGNDCHSNTFGNHCYFNTFGNYCNSNTFDDSCYSNTFDDSCYSNTFGNNCNSTTFGNYCTSNTFGNGCYSNTFGNGCYSNTFGHNCYSNTFGNNCGSNTFGNECNYNTFGNNCSSTTFSDGCCFNTFGDYCTFNTFGNGCFSNTFGNECSSDTFGDECNHNTFRNNCTSNTFGDDCDYNTFGNNCGSNTFGNDCGSNTFVDDCDTNTFRNNCNSTTFGNGCRSNTFGDYCTSNTFGNYCGSNTFGNDCSSNTFGNDCSSNTFGNGCNHILLKNDTYPKNFVRNIIVESGNQYITLNMTGTSTSYAPYRNVTLAVGLNDTTTNKTITDSTNGGQTFKTVFQPANSQVISV